MVCSTVLTAWPDTVDQNYIIANTNKCGTKTYSLQRDSTNQYPISNFANLLQINSSMTIQLTPDTATPLGTFNFNLVAYMTDNPTITAK